MQSNSTRWQDEFRSGFQDIAPMAVGVVVYGLAFGLLCAQAGMNGWQTGFMGISVFAASSQIVAVERLVGDTNVNAALVAGLALNLRIFLITASMRNEFGGRSWWQQVIGVHLSTDENWALMHATRNRGVPVGYYYFVGGGSCLMIAWLVATVSGVTLANNIPEPRSLGMDFAFAAAFIAIACSLWKNKSDLFPWIISIALVLALVAGTSLEPAWAVAVGGAAGAVFAGLCEMARRSDKP